MKHILPMILLAALLLSGCERKPDVKVVSGIFVEQENASGSRIYTDPHKMQRVLNSLRQLGQRYHPDMDPDALDAPLVSITLHFSDGSRSNYRLKADRYIQTDHQEWQQTNADQIQRLHFLLKALPGDSGADIG